MSTANGVAVLQQVPGVVRGAIPENRRVARAAEQQFSGLEVEAKYGSSGVLALRQTHGQRPHSTPASAQTGPSCPCASAARGAGSLPRNWRRFRARPRPPERCVRPCPCCKRKSNERLHHPPRVERLGIDPSCQTRQFHRMVRAAVAAPKLEACQPGTDLIHGRSRGSKGLDES